MSEASILETESLTGAHQAAACERLVAWLEAWKRQAWGTMSHHCQTPQAVGVGEPEMCAVLEQRLSTNHLEKIRTPMFKRGNIEKLDAHEVGFADFAVEVKIRGAWVGIMPRVIHNGKRWGVNFTSVNRRFAVKKEG